MDKGIFYYSLKFQCFPVGKAIQEYQRLIAMPHAELLKWREEKKWEILNWHLANNPYYKDYVGNIKINDWNDLPVIKKSFFQRKEHPVSENFNIKKLYWSKTSGSSGTPLYFAKDKWSHAMTWADIAYRFKALGINYGKDLQARFYGMPLEGLTHYKEKLKDFLSGRVRFVVHDMSESILDKYVERFRKSKFEYIYGYTNSIMLFCKYLDKNGIRLKEVCPTLKTCVVTSEVCTELDKKFISDTLNLPVYNEYGCSEFGVLALHNADNEWELSGINDLVEILDSNNKPVPDNQVGKIVVTSLLNKAMPFIRYELGDMGAINHSNGRIILKKLEGRLNDIVKLPSGKLVPGFTLYYVLKAMMNEIGGLREYKIWQKKVDHIHFQIVSDDRINEEQTGKIKHIVEKYLEKGLTVTIENCDTIKRTKAGKMKHFESLI